MKNIKTYITILLLFSLPVVLSSSCYSEWVDAYNEATEAYLTGLNECADIILGVGSDLCEREVELIYNNALEDAGNTFINC